MKQHPDLDARLRDWKRETDRLPAHLAELPPRVRAAARKSPEGLALPRRLPRALPRALALAASLALTALALGVLVREAPQAPPGGIDLVGGEALEAIVSAQATYERGAQRNEADALRQLARASDPDTPASEAAHLVALQDRLSRLEHRIERSEDFLAKNPFHAPARLALLRAHEKRDELLSQLAARPRMRT